MPRKSPTCPLCDKPLEFRPTKGKGYYAGCGKHLQLFVRAPGVERFNERYGNPTATTPTGGKSDAKEAKHDGGDAGGKGDGLLDW